MHRSFLIRRVGVGCVAGVGLVGCSDLATYRADLEPPRRIAPLSGMRVTSAQPTLRWQLAPASDGARVEICADRACQTVAQTVEVAGASARPAHALAPGVWFWRLRSRAGATVGPAATTPWNFVVGPRGTPVDTAWNHGLDVDGDGHADVVVGGPAAGATGRVYVFLGGPRLRSGASPDAILQAEGLPNRAFGAAVARAGDVDGDGYDDVLVGAPADASSTGRAYVFRGGARGLHDPPDTVLVGVEGAGDAFADFVAGPGDTDGDGYDDVVVSAYTAPAGGRVYRYGGGPHGTEGATPRVLATPAAAVSFGVLAGAGDVNADGLADVIVGAPDTAMANGAAYLFLGDPSEANLVDTPAASFAGSVNGRFGQAVGTVGDLDGDGYAELAIASDFANRVDLFPGASLPSGTSPWMPPLGPPAGLAGDFGFSVSAAGDVNRDGYGDTIVGAYDGDYAVVVLGSARGPGAPTVLTGAMGTQFGRYVGGAGDVDGDGFNDVIVSAPSEDAGAGAVYLYFGSPSGIEASPRIRLAAPDPGAACGPLASAGGPANVGSDERTTSMRG